MVTSAASPAISAAVACPVGYPLRCKRPKRPEDGRWCPEFFRINFSRCIFCGLCGEACPTNAIQLTPDYELAEYSRQDLVYEKRGLADQRHRQVSRLQLLSGRGHVDLGQWPRGRRE